MRTIPPGTKYKVTAGAGSGTAKQETPVVKKEPKYVGAASAGSGDLLLAILKAEGLPKPETEYRFSKRRFRFDLAWPEYLVAVEIEGGVWTKGRHVRVRGYEADCEKYNLAHVMGWKVLRYTPGMLRDTALMISQVYDCGVKK